MASATTTSLPTVMESLTITSPPDEDHEATRKWVDRISQQGPWIEQIDPLLLSGAPSLPMPVEVSDPESLAPFFEHLSSNGTHLPAPNGLVGAEPYYDTEMIEFEKGVLYKDGRVDLCKMVTGPRNIGALMESLKPNTFAKHFLLGNNIIGPTGAKAIANFIKEYPERFETWYLAGNCIDTASFSILVDAMVQSNVITNIWLKRNPLGPGSAKDLFRLITQSSALRTLDLDQTALGDAGVAELFSLLAAHDKSVALRHIYLNANGVSYKACAAVSDYLKSPNCQIESLYLAYNPIGNAAALLAPGVKASTTLKRFSLSSCGLNDTGTIPLLQVIPAHQSLKVFDIGHGYATRDLGARFNWLTDESAPAVLDILEKTNLQYFRLSYTPMTQTALNSLLTGAINSKTLLFFSARPLVKGGKSYAEVKAGQAFVRISKQLKQHLCENVVAQYGEMSYEEFDNSLKRFLVSPEDVRNIDSVYRNRDSAMAKRGLKKLVKWWEEGNGTLERVMEGNVD